MSDSTELTFIRCPSCRSLVPALSTRCRMCGASLDKNAAAPKAAKPAAPVAPVATADSGSDPLADYLSELENEAPSTPAPAPKAAKPVPAPVPESDDEDDQDDEEALNELEKLLEELKSAEEGLDDAEPEAVPAPVKPEAPKKVLAKKPEPIPVAEPADIDDGIDEFAEADEVVDDFTDEEPVAVPPPVKVKPASNGFKKPAEITAKPAAPAVKPAPLKSQPLKSVPVKPQPVKAVPAREVPAPRQTTAPVTAGHSLIGWFVSYNNEAGTSMELRSGRYFISRNKIKGHDILIEDESISTPHALLVLDSQSGIHVQDLLSEEGVFVRRAGTADYEQVEDTEVLENGDWIRFGKIEYLLVLVPGDAR